MQTPPNLHSSSTAARSQHMAEVGRASATVGHYVVAAAWALFCVGYAVTAQPGDGPAGAGFFIGSALFAAIVSLPLAFVFQAVGRLFYRQPPLRAPWTPTLWANAAVTAVVLAALSALGRVAG